MFGRIHLWSYLVLGFCLLEDFWLASISVLVMGLIRFCIFSGFSFGKLYFSKSSSISSKLSISLAYDCWLLLLLLLSIFSCVWLCDPIDGSPSGFPVPGILQARTLEWVTISFSNAWKWKVKVKSLSRVWPSVTPWTAAHQAPPSMGFARQEYWSGVPLPSPYMH